MAKAGAIEKLKALAKNRPTAGAKAFQEWAATGKHVPASYKGREQVWDKKVKKFSEGGYATPAPEAADIVRRFDFQGMGEAGERGTMAGGRLGYAHPMDEQTMLRLGLMGHYAKGRGFKDKGIDAADIGIQRQLGGDSSLGFSVGAGKGRGINRANVTYNRQFAEGGAAYNTVPDMADGGQIIDGPSFAKGGAAFGTFPQMKPRRAKQDREASKNVPVDLARGFVAGTLGMPGDIESLARMPYEYFSGEKSPTFLPTSEEIEKRLPFRSDAPVSKAATGLGQFAGGFYTGPGSGARAAMAIPEAVGRAGKEFVQAAGQPAVNVVKPKGGNWLTGSVEKALNPLKAQTIAGETPAQRIPKHEALLSDPSLNKDQIDRVLYQLDETKKEAALDQWIDRNLANYVKKEMATPEDPVRMLAEQGISHLPEDALRAGRGWIPESTEGKRMKAGYPAEGMGRSEAAQGWENLSDVSMDIAPASRHTEPLTASEVRMGMKSNVDTNPWLTKVAPDTPIYYPEGDITGELGFNHIMDVLRQDVAGGRIRPEQLSKVSMEQAVRRTHEFDQEMAKKMRESQIKATEGMPVHKEYPEGYKWIELAPSKTLPEGWTQGPSGAYVGPGGERSIHHPNAKQLEEALKYEGETMGHCVGGYCPDVTEGRSRIYSLRDPKGEPHVTIEVRPTEDKARERIREAYSTAGQKGFVTPDNEFFHNQSEAIQHEMKNLRFEPELRPDIIQIKGKQNRAPKEEYLPYVQDFVRGGQWSDVGDIGNTGMRATKNVFSQAELQKLRALGETELPHVMAGEDIQRYHNMIVPEGQRLKYDAKGNIIGADEGSYASFAHGGEVKAASNCDCQHEPKMQAGGVAKLLKGLQKGSSAAEDAATAAQRAAAGRMSADVTKATAPMKMSEALGNLNVEGKGRVKVTQSDRTRVGGGNIGGAMFPGLSQVDPLYEGLVWGVGKKPTATNLINQSDDSTYWTTLLGSEDQLKSNPIVFNKLRSGFVDAMKEGKLPSDLERKINKNLSLTFGEGADIRDPKIWQKADTFEKRTALADVMLGQGIPPSKGGVPLGGEKSGKGVIFKPSDILRKETEPMLMHPEHGGDVPTFAVGPRLFQFSGGMKVRPDLHPGFPVLLEGQDLGMVFKPAPGEVAMRDFTERMLTERNRKPGYYEWTMGEKGKGLPAQPITEDYLTYLQQQGFAEGGKVKSGLSALEKV